MKKSVIWIGASLVSIVVIFVVINAVNFQTDELAEVQRLQSATPASQVEERFGLEKDWQKNGAANLYTTRLLEGELASERTGVILTDTDCEADAQESANVTIKSSLILTTPLPL